MLAESSDRPEFSQLSLKYLLFISMLKAVYMAPGEERPTLQGGGQVHTAQ